MSKEFYQNCDVIWQVSAAMKGVGALLEQQSVEVPFKAEELEGLGICLKLLAQKLDGVEGSIRVAAMRK